MESLREIARALTLALRQLGDGRLLRIVLLAFIIAAVTTGPILLALSALIGLLNLILPDSITLPWIGHIDVTSGFTDGLLGRTAWLFWTYIMSPLTVAIIGALLDPIVEAVEARHYPDLPSARNRGLGDTVLYAVRFFFLMIGISLIAWTVAGLTAIPATAVFVLASGYLIAREYLETVAARRVSMTQAKRIMHVNLPVPWLTGCLVALALNIPFANLVAPVIGVAAFTHQFHSFQRIQAD